MPYDQHYTAKHTKAMTKTSKFIELSNEYRDRAEEFIRAAERGRSLVLVATDLEASQTCSLVYGDADIINFSLFGLFDALPPDERIKIAQVIIEKASAELKATDTTNQTAN